MTDNNKDRQGDEVPMSEWMQVMLEEMRRKADEREEALDELQRRDPEGGSGARGQERDDADNA